MARAEAKLKIKAEDEFSKTFNKAKKGLGSVDKAGKRLTKTFAALGGAAALIGATRKAIDTLSELSHISDRLNISVEALSAMRVQALDTGSSMQSLERALRNFKERVTKAAGGAKGMQKSLALVGLSAKDLGGMPIQQALATFAGAVTNAEDQSKAFLAVQQILGVKAGPELMKTLEAMGGGWDAFFKKTSKSGRVASDDVADAMEAIGTFWSATFDRAVIKIAKLIRWFQKLRSILPANPLWQAYEAAAGAADYAKQVISGKIGGGDIMEHLRGAGEDLAAAARDPAAALAALTPPAAPAASTAPAEAPMIPDAAMGGHSQEILDVLKAIGIHLTHIELNTAAGAVFGGGSK